MRFLHVIASVDPRGGGPIEGLLRIHGALQALGHQGEILCLDAPDFEPVLNHPGRIHALGPVRGTYGYCEALAPWLRQHAGNYDAVIINGLWQYIGLAAWRALRDTGVIIPAGSDAPGVATKRPGPAGTKWPCWARTTRI